MRGHARLVAAVAAVSVVWLAFFFLFIRPRQGDLKQTRAQIESETNKTVQLGVELDRLQELQDNAVELDAELAALKRLIPPRNEVANFIFLTEQAAKRAGIGFIQITPELPKPPPEGAPVAEVRASIGATGTYFAMQDFFRRLYDLDRAVRIDVVSLTSGGEEGTGTTTSTTSTTSTNADVAGSQELDALLTVRVFFEAPGGASSVAAAGSTTSPSGSASEPAEATPAPTTTTTP